MAVDYTATIVALRSAIASGAQTISVEGKSITYRSIDDMIKAVAYFERLQDKQNGKGRPVAGYAAFAKGYLTRGSRYPGR